MKTLSKSDRQLLIYSKDEKAIELFYSRCEWTKDGCLAYKYKTFHNGYGMFSPCSWVSLRAHRFSFVLDNGRLPKDGLLIRHTCNNRICVNPLHLKEGTQKENVNDCVVAGRRKKKQELTHCVRGHKFVEGSYTLNAKGYKLCRLCARILNERNRNNCL